MIFLKRRALMTRASFNYKTVSGIGSITLENCVETRFKRLELLGSSAQGENPSIESPQEIKNSGKYDEVSGKYVIDVGVTGKNLFDYKRALNPQNYIKGSYGYYGMEIKAKKGEKYTFERNLTNGYGLGLGNAGLKDDNMGTAFFVVNDTNDRLNASTITITATQDKIYFVTNVTDDEKLKLLLETCFKNPMLNAGEESNEYEPYKEPQTTQIALDESLRGIGQYKDVITKDGILRKIKEIVLDENTGFTNHLGGIQNKTICFATHILKDATNIAALNNAMSDKIEKVTYVDGQEKECFTLFNKQIYIKLNRERNVDTVEKLKEWLRQNPIKVQYVLQEPILETFENSLGNLHANDGTTIVSVDSGEVETGIEVEYAVKN